MKRSLKTFAIAMLVVALLHGTSLAASVTLSPGDISGLDTNTVSFSNGDLTLTPTIGGAPATFNGNAARLGIDDQGSNANAFNDPDTDPNNGNEERLEFAFSSDSGLTGIAWDFSRADGPGPDDGVIITGFTADPGASVDAGASTEFPNSVSYNAGALNIQITGANFGGTIHALTLANPSASFGQTLLMTVTDTTQDGAQLAIRSISYEVIPEPTTLMLGSFATLMCLVRRK